jgi:hypothetical protein
LSVSLELPITNRTIPLTFASIACHGTQGIAQDRIKTRRSWDGRNIETKTLSKANNKRGKQGHKYPKT